MNATGAHLGEGDFLASEFGHGVIEARTGRPDKSSGVRSSERLWNEIGKPLLGNR